MTPRSMPPVAATLLEAMRAIGYSFETALADIVERCGASQVPKENMMEWFGRHKRPSE